MLVPTSGFLDELTNIDDFFGGKSKGALNLEATDIKIEDNLAKGDPPHLMLDMVFSNLPLSNKFSSLNTLESNVLLGIRPFVKSWPVVVHRPNNRPKSTFEIHESLDGPTSKK